MNWKFWKNNRTRLPNTPKQPRVIYFLEKNQLIPLESVLIFEELNANALMSAEPMPIFIKYNNVLFRATLIDSFQGNEISYKKAECAKNCIIARRIVFPGKDIKNQFDKELVPAEKLKDIYSGFKMKIREQNASSIMCAIEVVPRELILRELKTSEFYVKRHKEMKAEYDENLSRVSEDYEEKIRMEKEHYTLLLNSKQNMIQTLLDEKDSLRKDYEDQLEKRREDYEERIERIYAKFEQKLYDKKVKERASKYNGGPRELQIEKDAIKLAYEEKKKKEKKNSLKNTGE